jgi:hypothetical protein
MYGVGPGPPASSRTTTTSAVLVALGEKFPVRAVQW